MMKTSKVQDLINKWTKEAHESLTLARKAPAEEVAEALIARGDALLACAVELGDANDSE